MFFTSVQSLPWTHYLYCLVPVALWHKVAQKWYLITALKNYVVDTGILMNCAIAGVIGIIGLEIIVSFCFHILVMMFNVLILL